MPFNPTVLPVATAQVYRNPLFSPELRNMGKARQTPRPDWLCQSDEIVQKYKEIGVPPPFGRANVKNNNWSTITPVYEDIWKDNTY